MIRRALLTASLLLGAGIASAQPAATARITGAVESLSGERLVVRTGAGQDVAVTLGADVRIGAVADRRLSDIRPGDFVGSAAVKGMDGKLHAQEVHIFPEALRGTGEGHRPMAGPEQSMTNATVAEVAVAPNGQMLRLKYPDGVQEIEVAPDVRVVALVPGDRSLLKPGAAVVVSAIKAADGTLTARSVQAEKDGVKPLM